MEYISAEEFLKQPKEVQKVFIDWWKLNVSKGDLFSPICPKGIGVLNGTEQRIDGLIPLFTEGQIRKFIEDKTGDIILFDYDDLTQPHSWYCHKGCEAYKYMSYKNLGADLLQVYWQVACEIAKEELN